MSELENTAVLREQHRVKPIIRCIVVLICDADDRGGGGGGGGKERNTFFFTMIFNCLTTRHRSIRELLLCRTTCVGRSNELEMRCDLC